MPRLLLVAPNWLGDTLFATALIRAIRQQAPEAHLTVVCAPRAVEVLRGNPSINELIVYDERRRNRRLLAKWRLYRRHDAPRG